MTGINTSRQAVREWWATSIIDVEPGSIRMRGYPIQDLIGTIGFAEMIWLMLRGEVPDRKRAELLEAALVSAVDHGPQAPAIAIARMVMTCGGAINNGMASAINALDDVHGGAGQNALELYNQIDARMIAGETQEQALETVLQPILEIGGIIPGFGHRFHPTDPRAHRLLELADKARDNGVIQGRYIAIGLAVEGWLEAKKKRHLPMNIDGITAVIYGELGFEPTLARGLFVLSRSVGILAHAHEQSKAGGRIKGPVPPAFGFQYKGHAQRTLKRSDSDEK